ncbi:GNAT family N-acetyltransferase [soil metagenome]|jgi:GNAT superfamily N-acetyltransferase
MSVEILVNENPSKEDLKIIYNGLFAFNIEAYGAPENKQQLIFLSDSVTGETLGGLYSVWFYNWLYIPMLFVPEALRGQGFGQKLLGACESYARSQNSTGIWLDTYSFQAPGFYERAGYEKFGELPNFPPGNSRIFYRKLLS